jgi:hypothetical protein
MTNSNPALQYGDVPTPAQWNGYFGAKQDFNAILDAIIAAGGINRFGATGARPAGVAIGTPYFDTTLGVPCWWNGTIWVNSTGGAV